MDEIKLKKIDIKRFNTLAAQSRSPAASYISKEIEWWTNEDESILGVVLIDIIDKDFVGILMGRDETNKFCAFDLETSIPTVEQASLWVQGGIKWKTGQGEKIFPQGNNSESLDLFEPIVSIEKQHPYFLRLSQEESFVPAKTVINELMAHFIDIDGNFVEQFQTTGFDSRLWELYLNTYLNEEQLFFDREHNSPDFLVKKYGKQVAIEAVTVGRKKDNPVSFFDRLPNIFHSNDIKKKLENEMPIKFGSSLFSKLKKEYWKLKHVKNKPLVFAIADFHDDQSMQWSSTALINYLYGVKHDFHYDDDNQLVITPLKINTHQVDKKIIPSGFFFQPNAENISSVMFSSSGTISKFNRIGKQAGFGSDNVVMYRSGTCHDHNPNAIMPKTFMYQVTTKSNENWSEGLSMFHNPNAKYPVPEELFPSIAHHYFDDGQIISNLPEFYTYSSTTINMRFT